MLEFDNKVGNYIHTPVTSRVWTHDNVAGDIIIVGCMTNSGGNCTVRYDGWLTRFITKAFDQRLAHLFYRINPTTGENSVDVGSIPSGYFHGFSLTIKGCDTASPFRGAGVSASSASGTTPTVTATTLPFDWVVDMGGTDHNSTPRSVTVGANQTELVNGSPAPYALGFGSYEMAASTSTIMSWALSAALSWGLCALVVKPLETPEGGSQAIWCMSKIYDRIQENRKKLGIGDLGGFKRSRNGLWKPQSGLVTI